MLETIAGMNHTVNVLRLKAGHIDIKKGVEDIFADLLDTEIEKQMDELMGAWNGYKLSKLAAEGIERLAKMAPESSENRTKASETF
jgi:hypothetical protein